MNFGAFADHLPRERRLRQRVRASFGPSRSARTAALASALPAVARRNPPTAGFIGKYYLFSAAMKEGYAWLAVLAVVMSAVSLFYYFRIAAAMFFSEATGAKMQSSYTLTAVVLICAAGTLLIGVAPQPVLALLRACVLTP
jgi:NADH-quinone oxidoreductase subunit N